MWHSISGLFICKRIKLEEYVITEPISPFPAKGLAKGIKAIADVSGSGQCTRTLFKVARKSYINTTYDDRPEKIIIEEYLSSYGSSEKGRGVLNLDPMDVFPSLHDEHLIRRFGEFMALAYTKGGVEAISAMSSCNTRMGKFEVIKARKDHSGHVIYYIAKNLQQNTTILVFRGSASKTDYYLDLLSEGIALDMNVLPVGLTSKDDARIHRGFWERFMNYRELLTKDVQEVFSNPDIRKTNFVVVGHSLGAAWAFLQAADLVSNFQIPVQACYLYGMPLSGNQVCVDAVAKVIGEPKIIRIVNWNDVVPHMGMGPDGAQPRLVPETFYDLSAEQFIQCTADSEIIGSARFSCGNWDWDYHSQIGNWSMRPEFSRISALRVPRVVYDV
jgi:hypothetical protein